MNTLTDQDLLRNYTACRSEAAFSELVRRHVDFVYSGALRMVRDAHTADDVTQGVFVALAENAEKLTDRPVLAGWLHRTTRFLSSKAVRSDVRRRAREQEAAAMIELSSAEPDAVWEQIAPTLDTALDELDEADRDVLFLRYFQHKSAREISESLGINEEAAKKRVSRAVERLREFFIERGISVGAAGIIVAISANAVQAAPIGLAASITTAAILAGTSIAATISTQTTVTTMNWLNIKSIAAIVAAVIAAGTGTRLMLQHDSTIMRTENQDLIVEKQRIADQLTRERDAALSAVAANRDEMERLLKNQPELLRLRGEVSEMRRQLQAQKAQTNALPVVERNASKAMTMTQAPMGKSLLKAIRITLPEFELNDATFVDAILKLRASGRQYDKDSAGVNFMVLDAANEQASGKITLHLKDVTLAEAIYGVAEAAGLRVSPEDSYFGFWPKAPKP